jgi:hypothetical protein
MLCACQSFDNCPTNEDLAPSLAKLPDRLSETGLFAELDSQHESIAPGIEAYTPAFELWSDGATKRRWLSLPEGASIDTSDPDDWQFPKGTRLWKEFTRDGTRVETRILFKFGEGESDWAAAAYVWREDRSDADLAPDGAEDVLGTAHDVPAANRCMGCHGGRKGRVLGYSAVQLDPKLPGNETERAALGYLHANCSHCHNASRPESDGPRCYDPRKDIDMFLKQSRLGSVHETPTYETVVGSAVEPGDPEGSELFELVSRRSDGEPSKDQMPPLASERVDEEGVALLRKWISEMDR